MEIGAELEKGSSASSCGIRPKAKQAAAATTAVVTGGTRSSAKEMTMANRMTSAMTASLAAIQFARPSSMACTPCGLHGSLPSDQRRRGPEVPIRSARLGSMGICGWGVDRGQ